MKRFIICIVMIWVAGIVNAQDTIVLKSGSRIIGYVHSADSVQVQYSLMRKNDLVLSVPADYVLNICFGPGSDGSKFVFNAPIADSVLCKNALKLGVLSPVLGHVYISYEKAFKHGVNIEFTFGGVLDQELHLYTGNDVSGAYARLGVRMYFNNKIRRKGVNTYSPLYGHYIGLLTTHEYLDFDSYYSTYDYDSGNYSSYETHNYLYSGTIHWVYGFQFPIGERLVLNPMVGAGFTLSRKSSYFNSSGFEYSVVKPFGNAFSLTGGLQIGYIF